MINMSESRLVPADSSGQRPGFPSLRSLNRARIISLVRRNPGVTRVDLSRLSGLSKSTVSTVIAEFLDERILFEDGEDGKQRKTGLFLNRDAGVAVGFDIRPGEVRGILADLSMRVLRRCVRPLPTNLVQTTVDTLVSMYEELTTGVALPCLGAVVALPGPTDRSGQVLMLSPNLGWTEVPVGRILTEKLGQPVSVINVPRAMTLGEYWYGAGIGAQDMVQINISSGIGAGVLVGGQLFQGARGYGSEIGHTTVLPDGPLCPCGNRGCLEQLASMPAIIERARERAHSSGVSGRDWQAGNPNDPSCYSQLIEAVLDGDPIAVDVVRQASQYIGIAVANIIDLLNPSLIVIGGPLAEVGELLISGIRETAQRRSFPLSYKGVEIVRSRLGADAACIGACALVIDRYVAEVEPAVQAGLY